MRANVTRLTGFLLVIALAAFGGQERAPRPEDLYNYAAATQTFAPTYHFTSKTLLAETADAIRAMGSNAIKFTMSEHAFTMYGLPRKTQIKTLADMARLEPSVKRVLAMPFYYYFIWAYPHSISGSYYHPWRDGVSAQERAKESAEIFDFVKYLLTAFNGSGKTFYLGHWEGDWALLGHYDTSRDPDETGIRGMIDWLRLRQKAVDDARRAVPHKNVWVYHYSEVNLVQKAMRGRPTVTNSVLPTAKPDFVSYSCYDSLGDIPGGLPAALEHIKSKLPAKKSVPGTRVFIGEYGFPLEAVATPQKQDECTRLVLRTALGWGCPFVLYWQMYCNEVVSGRNRGFWMINNRNVKQPVYYTHKNFYRQAKAWVAAFLARTGRPPSRKEFGTQAVLWLE